MTDPEGILKNRDITLPTKVCIIKAIVLSSSHVWMWELDHKAGWVPKNWCFWTVVLEKTLKCPLECKEIKPVNPKENQSWIFIRRTVAEAETPILWSPDGEESTHWKRSWCWERLKARGEGATEDKMVGWHHWFNGHEFEQSLGVTDGQESLVCCSHGVIKRTQLGSWTAKMMLRI